MVSILYEVKNRYDVIVVGAGHAGCEAAHACVKLGKKVLLATINLDYIALLPCNPSIGGPAKAHLVREVDALGGLMGEMADRCAIQMRMLNTTKGPAVHSLRGQMDKAKYQRQMRAYLENLEGLDLKQMIVDDLIVKEGKVCGVITEFGGAYYADAVILATGTYLGGAIVIGDYFKKSGPNGQLSAEVLPDNLKKHGLSLLRFKTGTPARVDCKTIDFSKLTLQPHETGELKFSSFTKGDNGLEKRPCYLTYTTDETHDIIRQNLHRSPVEKGEIAGIAPRYCPSIEDKVVRFHDKARHQIFVEPEGLETKEMYIQGFATSLPMDVQRKIVRSLPGFEQAELMRPAYAIEYDLIDPYTMKPSMESKVIEGLFLAGQINGTSGYEEAAAQGIMAGINASRYLDGKDAIVLKRYEAYIGVLIDDLVTKGVEEPYRMLTSRAEYRLLLRQDNACERLSTLGYEIGLLSEEKYQAYLKEKENIASELKRLSQTTVKSDNPVIKAALEASTSEVLKQGVPALELLKRPQITYALLEEAGYGNPLLSEVEKNQVSIQVKYEGYIKKQEEQVARLAKLENYRLYPDTPYEKFSGLRLEAQQKLIKFRPETLGQASRISGVNPADISVLLIALKKENQQNDK